MAEVMAQRNGSAAGQAILQRQTSFSSFPPSRSPSSISTRNDNKKGRSPQPPMLREDEVSLYSSHPHSRNSSLSAPRATKSKGPRKLRSQYPADSVENHVEYILVASFDIDRGSVMEHQYPGPISGDETMLAELMLPDQAHVRSQDWTIFFLHKDTSAEDEEKEARRERRRKRRRRKEGLEDDDATAGAEEDGKGEDNDEETDETDDDDLDDESEEEEDDIDGPPLVYVLNLVNTKQDNTVKRGAIVKAMAVCTRHSFLHIYKPLLLLALEEYFRAPIIETLASLYNAVNAMDLSLMPKLSILEGFILQASDAKDMFIEKFDQMIQQRMAEDAERDSLPSAASSGSDPRRPGNYAPPRDTHEFESRVNYNGIPVPIKVPTALSAETVGDFSLIKLIQTFSAPHSQQPQPFALHPHLTTSGAYTHPIIVLVNALLTQKRIIFLGHNRPSSEVAEAVLGACALASGGLLRGIVRHAFPYTDLTKIDDLLKVPGFIAGVTNPAFSHKPEWWDLLCDLPTGRMKISHRIEGAPVTEGLLYFQQQGSLLNGANGATPGPDSKSGAADPTGDTQFMDGLLQSIANRHGENAIRAKWRSWILKFTRIAAAFEETVYGASALYIGSHETEVGAYGVSGHGFVWPDEASRMRELAANVHRVEGWRSTRSYYSFVQDLARRWTKRPVRGIDLHHQHDRLRCLRLTHEQSAAIYLAFARAVEEAGEPSSSTSDVDLGSAVERSLTLSNDPDLQQRQPSEQLQYDTILQLLTVIPESNGGLFYISLGLFHPRQDVRVAVVKLLERIVDHPAGRHFWATLGRFAKLAFFRVKREEVGHGR
ncbi:spindle pole body interacting protein [Zopfia rhizophila CBS 207.26]|uniref:Spindle pole body interacting protein n=1 Tax=Zopfia rhizophila CBS 207.26 TaxID=1314779 RepID=A0A6A6EME2_9PEZI|nr:spindle pole body interacting protein [Zopfia rhizophila CBS 207.26]